ncbi:cation:proton antiporter [Nonomuraea sp. NPDC050451]|uniref:cation:proton antiporter domain-containing protein n=1 Tax=Nonomuraea sp. NPDC050451 TaxID=3364364 RepID=UPI00378DA08F
MVATFTDRISVPAPSLLVLAGLLVGLTPYASNIHVSPEIVSLVVLPPLIYAAGEELSWHELKRVWKPVTLLTVGLVVVSAAAVGFVTVLLTPLPLALGFVLGAVGGGDRGGGGGGGGARPAAHRGPRRAHPAAAGRRLRHGDLPAGERGVQPHRAAAAQPDPAAVGGGAVVAARRTRRRLQRHLDREDLRFTDD